MILLKSVTCQLHRTHPKNKQVENHSSVVLMLKPIKVVKLISKKNKIKFIKAPNSEYTWN